MFFAERAGMDDGGLLEVTGGVFDWLLQPPLTEMADVSFPLVVLLRGPVPAEGFGLDVIIGYPDGTALNTTQTVDGELDARNLWALVRVPAAVVTPQLGFVRVTASPHGGGAATHIDVEIRART